MKWRHDYRTLLSFVLDNGTEEINARTGEKIITAGITPPICVIPNGTLPLIDLRKTYPGTAAAEAAWFLQGEQDTSWLSKYTKIWGKFEEGLKTSFFGAKPSVGVKAAYGYRWRKHFGVDQISLAVQELVRDPSSRRVWVSTWDPKEDLEYTGQKNVPCPVGFSLYFHGNALCSTYVLRSSDLFVGLPYDVMNHALLMQAVASSLPYNCFVGGIHIIISHGHLYSKHKEMALEALSKDSPPTFEELALPNMPISEILMDPDRYVHGVRRQADQKTDWPAFNPKPEVIV